LEKNFMEALVVVKRNTFVIGIAVMLTLLVHFRLTGVTWALPFVSSLPTGVLHGVPGDLAKV
jgi:hypothetical protein